MVSIATLIFLGLVYCIAVFRPAWAIAVVMTMFPIEQALQASSPMFRAQGSLANLAVGALVVVSLLVSAFRGRLLWSRWITPILILIISLYAYAALSILWTASNAWLQEYIRWNSPYILVTVGLAPLLFGQMKDLRELRVALLIVATGVAVLILVNPNFSLVNGRLVVSVDADARTNPLAIGALGGLVVLLSVLGPAREERKIFWVLRVVAFVAGLGLGFQSGSRGEMVAAVVASVTFLPMARRINNIGQFAATAAAAVIFAVGFVLVAGLFVSDDNEARWSSQSLVHGSAGRLENVIELATFYFKEPMLWFTGLGSNAFHELPTSTGDPYSHVLIADVLFELGVPGTVLFGSIVVLTFRNGRSLLAALSSDPILRAAIAFHCGYVVFQFVISNKAGTLWGGFDLFFGFAFLARLAAVLAIEREAGTFITEEDEAEYDEAFDEPSTHPSDERHYLPSEPVTAHRGY